MSTTPLWLIQNVHLPQKEGLWQIAIDKGRFGDITPMGEARSESYEVLNARGGLAIRRLSNRTFISIPRRRRESRTGTSPERCSKGLSVGPSVKRC